MIVNPEKNKVDEKVAIVTGGTGGFGSVLVDRFLDKKFKVAWCSRNGVPVTFSNKFCSKVDVRDGKQSTRFVSEAMNRWGRVDVLVVNAGVNADGVLLKKNVEDIDKVVDTNLKGFFNSVKAVLPYFTDAKNGHIVVVSSYVGSMGRAGQSIYCATKSALIGAVKSIAKEVGADNIKVNAVMPGFMDVGMGARAGKTARMLAVKENVLGRLGSADESAEFVVNLCMMNNVSGQIFNLDSRVLGWL